MILQQVDRPVGRTIEEVATQSMRSTRLKRVEGQAQSLNGDDAFVGVYQGELSGVGRAVMRAHTFGMPRSVFARRICARSRIRERRS